MRTLKFLFPLLLVPPLAAPADIAGGSPSFAWLSGHWCSQSAGTVVEEYWMPPAGSVALGVGRTHKAGRTTAFEFLRIEDSADGVVYIAQPQGRPPTRFRLTASGPDWARFENPQHDFPQRVEYRRDGATLRAEIAGPGENGQESVIPFSYRLCGD